MLRRPDLPQTGSLGGRHDGLMKSQQRRDEETVTIFAGLLLFLLVTGAGAVALVLASRFVTLDGRVLNVLALRDSVLRGNRLNALHLPPSRSLRTSGSAAVRAH